LDKFIDSSEGPKGLINCTVVIIIHQGTLISRTAVSNHHSTNSYFLDRVLWSIAAVAIADRHLQDNFGSITSYPAL
jgi:hypothetical protein